MTADDDAIIASDIDARLLRSYIEPSLLLDARRFLLGTVTLMPHLDYTQLAVPASRQSLRVAHRPTIPSLLIIAAPRPLDFAARH